MKCGPPVEKVAFVVAIALVGILLGVLPSQAQGSTACEEGRYRIDLGSTVGRISPRAGEASVSRDAVPADFAESVLSDAQGLSRVIRIEAGRASVEGACEERRVRLRSGRRGTRVGIRWPQCENLDSRVYLRARIGPDCSLLRGTFSTRRPRSLVRFQADRIPECGDGVVDSGEACDAGVLDSTSCCTDLCQRRPASLCEPSPECGGAEGGRCGRREFCDLQAGHCGEANVGGFCEERTRHCTRQYEPVCGCDGKTYTNDCERRRSRVSKDRDGMCEADVCGVDLPPPFIPGCPENQRCDPPTGTCDIADAGGTCSTIPELCPQVTDPVCGCDEVTYPNDCERLRAGVAKDRDGSCDRPQACGGFMWPPAPACRMGQRCDQVPGTCNIADIGGTCAAIPEVCTAEWRPVCGCDGVTYGNDCERLRAGAAKHREGACDASCLSNLECGGGFFCQKALGQCEGAGVCTVAFPVCTKQYDPVCGCDGRTYSNACVAQSVGVSVAATGECSNPPN